MPNVGTLLRQCIHELAAAYEEACIEHGENSKQVQMIGEALLFMRGWMRRYSQPLHQVEAGGSAPP